ncbi:MAG: hypothetical protein DWP97_00530 [Calditrichaeota bacterium]|nr:MAG: hypothetical protein DWP97_00530 [Calditrichota bacterium]
MKLSILYSLLLTLIFSTLISAAHSNFTIDSYIPEKFIDKRWTIGGGINLSSAERESESGSFSNYKSERDQYNIRYNGEVSTAYSYRFETIPKFYSFSIVAATKYLSGTTENSDNTQRWGPYYLEEFDQNRLEDKEINTRLLSNITYGTYLKDYVFTNFSLLSNFNYNSKLKNKYYDDDYTTYHYNDTIRLEVYKRFDDRDNSFRRVSLNPSVSIGYGRLYSGRYAAIMLYIIEELREKEMLLQEPDSSQMFTLTDILYQYTNKHAVDNRLNHIEMLDSLYSYMVEQTLILEKSAYGLLIFDDIYKYYPRNPRNFGFRTEFGFTLEYEYRNQKESSFNTRDDYSILKSIGVVQYNDTLNYSYTNGEGESQSKSEFLNKGIHMSMQYSKPVTFRWHIDARISGRYYFDSYSIQKISSWYKSNTSSYQEEDCYYVEQPVRYNFYTSLNSDYIISTRTLLTNQISFTYDRVKPSPEQSSTSRKIWQLRLNNSLEYRLTIPTTLKIKSNYRHSKNDTSFSLSASLSHYIY